ncbi:MAG: sulfate reduction electron transfer complex DsrMKJOP subunit DsrJ [bacterium]|nr:sulfate reduction electron transfer complex DsrMKJOP subunit DsrJ [bacterium]
MYDKSKIIPGLIIFVGLVTLPFLYNLVTADFKPEASLDTPVINKMSKKQCVRSKDIMKTEHMKVLHEWRDSVVRHGEREYGMIDEVKYEKSLQKTCMKCHSNKKDFCDRCHTYVDVKPYCWNCHIAPEGK